ncbi:hypothetical protein JCM19237_6198 [Photobacterium aphoticum]|uniref:Uncharacterized protein n=1 Tax=Photobacterium aphoticum TaxID=754436 RepID=A0A090QJH7_9GAMM|nr:hypothetical protein JCM19237_6198 [Photobacterium aphoticum]
MALAIWGLFLLAVYYTSFSTCFVALPSYRKQKAQQMLGFNILRNLRVYM